MWLHGSPNKKKRVPLTKSRQVQRIMKGFGLLVGAAAAVIIVLLLDDDDIYALLWGGASSTSPSSFIIDQGARQQDNEALDFFTVITY